MPVGVEGKPAALTAKDVDEALIKLEVGIRDAYSYRDLRGVDWAAEMVATREEAKACTNGPELARLIVRRLGKAQDPHVSVRFDDFTLATYRRDIKPNINVRRLSSIVTSWKRIGSAHSGLFEGILDGGIGYLCIAGWSFDAADSDALRGALDRLKDAPGLVVDVRANSGGDELLARAFASCFVDKPTVYSRSLVRSVVASDGQQGEGQGWQGPFDRVVEPAAEGSGLPRYRGKVAVLMGPICMSSNESFLLMMRHGAGARLFGGRSLGSSGNPKPHDIGCGITVLLPSWKDLDIDGALVEGRGIAPDVSVEAQPADFEKEDPVLNKALAWLLAQAK
jgi:C-terminal processing protease CtpA/Prc